MANQDDPIDDKLEETDEKTASYASAAGALGLEKDELLPPETEDKDLEKRLKELEKLVETHKDKTMRAMAELENTRRIAKRDIGNAHKFALERFAADILPVMDSLEQGIEASSGGGESFKAVFEGLELTRKIFIDTLVKYGIESIDPVGESFNPDFHEAMSMQEAPEAKANSILAVIQKGYLLNGRVIRAAKVVVAKAES